MAEIEAYYQDCLKRGANEYQVEESKKQTVSIKSIIGDPDILQTVANNFIQHYETRVKEGSTVAGKCMFVCADRYIAYDFYNIVKKMRPEWVEERKAPEEVELTEEEEKKLKPMPMMKMVMTRGKDDPKDLYDLIGTDESRKEAAIQFKDINSNFKIAIVVDMWLTGFDVPFLDTIYIDKLLSQEHNIIQTISRVNRAYPGKDSGLIVDFIGIKSGMNLALKKYCKYDEDNIEGIEQAIIIVKDQLEVLDNMLHTFDTSVKHMIEQISAVLVMALYQVVAATSSSEQTITALNEFNYNSNSNYKLQNLMMISRVADVTAFSRRAQELNRELENKIEKSIIKYTVREYLLRNNVEIYGEAQSLIDCFFGGQTSQKLKMEIAKKRIIEKDRT